MEIAIISGKGGTGKSSVSAAFATMGQKLVLADCDVDAANLYLLFKPVHEEEQVYVSGYKAEINASVCTNCGLCIQNCRFGAISVVDDNTMVTETTCDGCKLCWRICPVQAIEMVKSDKSRMYSGSFRNGKMVYGRLAPGEENSGKLVSQVRDKAKKMALENKMDTIVIDGPPGIGCAVISSITGVDHVVIVTEPTISGLHDLKRTVEIVSKFNLKTWVIVNKYDLNPEMANQIENYCHQEQVSLLGKLPFDPMVVEAMVQCKSILEWAPTSGVAWELLKMWKQINTAS